MKPLSGDEMKRVVEQWDKAGPELERIRRAELQDWVYDWKDVDALLQMGDRFGASRPTSGLVTMQELLLRLS